MAKKDFNPVDLLQDLVYTTLHDTEVEEYEKYVIKIMMSENCNLSEALALDFEMNSLDTKSVFELVEYLETRLPTLNKVSFYMDVYTGKTTDFYLTKD